MSESDKYLCEHLLRYGEIIRDEEFASGEGKYYRHYQILYNGYKWTVSKLNGEWIYVNVSNRKVV